MNIVSALETLALPGMEKDHDRVIETVLSKLFIRGEEVYKAYKHRTADFADLTLPEVRRKYIAEDFFWNNTMAPDIYRELRHVRREGDQFVHVGEGEGEDWYIVMRKIDSSNDLMQLLARGELEQVALQEYVRTLLHRLAELTKARKSELEEFFHKGAAHLRSEVLGACEWALAAGAPELSPVEVERAAALMKNALESETYFQKAQNALSVVIDTNGENILFLDGKVSFIDVMPPKDAWRVHDPYFIVCRTSADVSALGDRTQAEVLHGAYGAECILPSQIVRTVYELAAALIQVPYRKMVGCDDLAAKYAAFVHAQCDNLAALIMAERKKRP